MIKFFILLGFCLAMSFLNTTYIPQAWHFVFGALTGNIAMIFWLSCDFKPYRGVGARSPKKK